MNEVILRGVGPARIDICCERLGNPADPPLLLIMGLAAQMVHWPDGFLDALLGQGLQLIRFDNRDAGRSTHLRDAGAPDFTALRAGDFSSAPYTLSHMAADAAGVLDALGIGAAHVVGASMGGAIAQLMAVEHPFHVLSLTSMMSSTGDPFVGGMDREVQKAVFGGEPPATREAAIAQALRIAPLLRSPAFPTPPEDIAARAGLAWDRGHDLLAPMRQGGAVLASGDRSARLARVRAPTLVIHGREDRLCDMSGGIATADAIPAAELLLLEGMGHDLPPALWPRLAGYIGRMVRRVSHRRPTVRM